MLRTAVLYPGQRRYALVDAVEVIPLAALAAAQDLFETKNTRA
jgi:hypothetical protein